MSEYSFYQPHSRAALYETWAQLCAIRRRVQHQRAELLQRPATSYGYQRHLSSSSRGSDAILRSPRKEMSFDNIQFPMARRLEWDDKRDTIDRGTQTTPKPDEPVGLHQRHPPQQDHRRVMSIPSKSTITAPQRLVKNWPRRPQQRHYIELKDNSMLALELDEPTKPPPKSLSTAAQPDKPRPSTFFSHLDPGPAIKSFPPLKVKWSQNTNYFQQRDAVTPSVSMQRRHTAYIGA